MKQAKAAFKFDATPEIGGGHAYRCLALADALARRGTVCVFATTAEAIETVPALERSRHQLLIVERIVDEALAAEEMGDSVGPVDLLVIDDYRLGVLFEQRARTWASSLAVIDDAPTRAHVVDVVIDPTHGRVPLSYAAAAPGARILAGSEYALLRPQFADLGEASMARREQRAGLVERILIAFGAGDPDNYSEAAFDILLQIRDIHISILVGASHPGQWSMRTKMAKAGARVQLLKSRDDVAELMVNSDLAIGAAGGMSWERCVLGLPSVAVSIADNQKVVGEAVARAGGLIYLGDGLEVMRQTLGPTVKKLLAEPAQLLEMSRAAGKMCDGHGASRVAELLLKLTRGRPLKKPVN